MKLVATDTPAGRLELAIFDPEYLEAARELVLAHAGDSAGFAGAVRFMGRDAWMKSSLLRGRARFRHSLRHTLLRAPLPRVREAINLAWLEQHAFQVPHPFAAGSLGGAAPRWQFLISEFVAGTPLDERLRAADASERGELLLELAQETARMHALGFVHRDLFWRNFLVATAPAKRRLVFIDAWRGGARRQARGPAYDLACLFLEGPSILRESEIRAWLLEYAKARAAKGLPIPGQGFWSAASSARNDLLARVRREPGRWRVPEAPVQEFEFEAAAR
ncbi:MAG TPA: lipopolysaccharide kinase InaA family protein [Planctomycetota bacterium]|nr:lipopolysaccharide kinase InaA family protein [Planctomycetota bacterium]